MELHEVTDLDQLPAYYATKGLASASEKEKIDHLKQMMRITAVRYEFGPRPDNEVLQGLEDYVVIGAWELRDRQH